MIKKCLPYSITVLKLNLLVSIMVTALASVLAMYLYENGITLARIIYFFIISFLTGGYLSGTLFFEMVKNREYYFYFNLGFSKLRLIGMTYLFHILLALPFIIMIIYAS